MVVSLLFSLHDFIRDYWKIPFRMCRLPRLAFHEVLRSMDHIELIKLAMVSKRMEDAIRFSKISLPLINMHISNIPHDLYVCLSNENILCCGTYPYNEPDMRGRQLEKWCPKDSAIEKLDIFVKRLGQLFLCKEKFLFIYFDKIMKTDVIMENVHFLNYLQASDAVVVADGKIESKHHLNRIMKLARADIDFELRRFDVPVDFESEYAFKFKTMIFCDSRWVKLENVLALKDCRKLTLERNTFKSTDMNTILKHWVTNDFDMFKTLDIENIEEIKLEDLFKELVYVKEITTKCAYYYIASKPDSKKSRHLMCFTYNSQWQRFTTWSADREENCAVENRVEHETLLKVLRLLEKKMEIEKSSENQKEIDEVKENLKNLDVQMISEEYVIEK